MFPRLIYAYWVCRDLVLWIQVLCGGGRKSCIVHGQFYRDSPLSHGRGRAKDGVIWPQARLPCPQPAWLKHETVVASFLLGLSRFRGLIPLSRTIVEMSSTLNMSLPLPCPAQSPHPPHVPSLTPMVLVLR